MSEQRERLEDVQKGLESLADAPALVGRDVATKSIDVADAYATQRELRKKFTKMNTADLNEMLDIQAARETGKQTHS